MTKATQGVSVIEDLSGRVAWGTIRIWGPSWRRGLIEDDYDGFQCPFLENPRVMGQVAKASGVSVEDIETVAAILKGEKAENILGDKLHKTAFRLIVSAYALEGRKSIGNRTRQFFKRQAGQVAQAIGVTGEEFVDAMMYIQSAANLRMKDSQYRSRRPWF